MRIINCEHPRIITDPHTGERIRVRCNKCATCLNAHAKMWINKLQIEGQAHKYAFMINLTYDDDHLPYLNRSGDDLVFANRDVDLRIPFNDLVQFIRDNSSTPESDIFYLNERLKIRLGLPCLCTKDISDFFKRLNKYIHDNITYKYGNFRYFLCHEYGPTTLRCHCHGVVYFDSDAIAKAFESAVRACWSFGDSSAADIYSNGGYSYVAQYVNKPSNLPKVYEFPKIRQRQQFSKSPSLGSDCLLVSDLSDLYERPFVRRTVWSSESGKYVDLPLLPSFKDRYFPKCYGYRKWTDSERIALYRITEFFPSEDFRQFCEAFYKMVGFFGLVKLPDGTYVSQITPKLASFFEKVRDVIKMNSLDPDKVEHRLYKFYLVSKRFCLLRDTLNTSDEWLYQRIDAFYKMLEYEQLKDFYSFQSSYSFVHPVGDLVHMYPEFSDDLVNLTEDKLSKLRNIDFKLGSFSLNLSSYSGVSDFNEVYDYQAMKLQHRKIYLDSHKNQEKNDYLYSEKFHYLNPTLQSLLIKYQTLCRKETSCKR